MAGFENNKTDKFYHISRHAELVIIKDRDVVAFVPEILTKGASTGMDIWRSSEKDFFIYSTSPPAPGKSEDVDRTERTLLWARLAGTDVVTGFRWVPYVTSSDPDHTEIRPLREVFAPRVEFDRTSNMLHLWFWTNVDFDYNGTEYDESILFGIDATGFQRWTDPAQAKRVLCYATGFFQHAYVEGGLVSGFQGIQGGAQGIQDSTNDMVPIFTRPVIINPDCGDRPNWANWADGSDWSDGSPGSNWADRLAGSNRISGPDWISGLDWPDWISGLDWRRWGNWGNWGSGGDRGWSDWFAGPDWCRWCNRTSGTDWGWWDWFAGCDWCRWCNWSSGADRARRRDWCRWSNWNSGADRATGPSWCNRG
jgi:hypothetical protein